MSTSFAPTVPFSIAVVLASAVLLGSGRSVTADIVYADGLNHIVTTPVNDRFIVTTNSTLTLGVGGSAQPPAPQGAQSVLLSQGTLVLSGGTIGGSFYGVNGTSAATLNATSGQVTGGNSGGTAVLLASGTGNFSGGSFIGGTSGGNALLLDGGSASSFLNTTISGGTFQGGANTLGQGGAAVFLTAFGTNILAISGGTFSGGVGSTGTNGGAALRLLTSTNPALDNPVSVTVTGGLFSGAIDIRSMYRNATVAFQGSGFSFTDNGNGTGILRGTLKDGSAINTLVLDAGDTVSAGSSLVIFSGLAFTAVPEPSPLVLGAFTALASAAIVRFRRMKPLG